METENKFLTGMNQLSYTVNVGGWLTDLSRPQVMGIVNATADSFYAPSRTLEPSAIAARVRQLMDEGATMIDVGACSTRPGSEPVDAATEWARLRVALRAVREVDARVPVSVDTFRADVASQAESEFGALIVNDISGGADAGMFPLVAERGLPYVLTYNQEVRRDVVGECLLFFAERVQRLRDLGQKDILLDPGFGFQKSLADNYRLLQGLEALLQFELPLLIGVSRKRMVYELLGVTPADALMGTQVLHTLCLQKGCAQILRVHDALAATQTIKIVEQYRAAAL